MKLYLGVDGGQSGTTALIGDERRVLGSGTAGPCNHAAAGEGRAKLERAITGSLEAACAHSGLDPALVEFRAACLGMSGGPDDKVDIVSRILRTNKLLVTTDAAIALAGAMAGGQGIITIAGTGSIAFGRNSEGRTARAGGWGYVFGDEGGAFDIVRQALRAALRQEEGWGPPTALREALLDVAGCETVNQALHHFYSPEWPRSRVARLAPVVDQAAQSGDAIAAAILTRAAQDLAGFACAVRQNLWPDGDAVEIAHVGGAFESSLIRERFSLLVELHGCTSINPRHSPAEGALFEARRAAQDSLS
jgi:N-acetylglucosamine kinase-like BadF-type ATPase